MRVVPERSPWVQIATALAAMVGGPWLGLQLGVRLTPGSEVVQTVSPFVFVLVLVGGLLLWFGLGAVHVVGRFFAHLVRGRSPRPEGLGASDRVVPRGYGSFVILGASAGIALGLLAGILTELSVPAGVAAWGVAGLAYGLALWAAAHHGYLPMPEPG